MSTTSNVLYVVLLIMKQKKQQETKWRKTEKEKSLNTNSGIPLQTDLKQDSTYVTNCKIITFLTKRKSTKTNINKNNHNTSIDPHVCASSWTTQGTSKHKQQTK